MVLENKFFWSLLDTSRASSGAWLGLFICIAGTCGVVVYKKKKGSIQV